MNQFWEAARTSVWLRYPNHNQQEQEKGPARVQENSRAPGSAQVLSLFPKHKNWVVESENFHPRYFFTYIKEDPDIF